MKDHNDLVRMAREMAPEALETIKGVMLHSLDQKLRLQAAEILLDRGFGKPVQGHIHIADDDGDKSELEQHRAQFMQKLAALSHTEH